MSIEIIDLEKLVSSETPKSSTIENFRLASNVFHIDRITAYKGILLENETSVYGNKRSFDTTIDTQEGRIIEYLRIYKINKDWKTAIQVKSEVNRQILYETVSTEINKEILQW